MKKKEGMPDLVYWGLWGINSRNAAYCYVVVSVLLGIVCIVVGFRLPQFFGGVLFFGAAYCYYYCIRWVDTHSNWD